LKFGPKPALTARGFDERVITFYVFFSDKIEMKMDLRFLLPGGIFREKNFFKIENRFALDKTLFKAILDFRLREKAILDFRLLILKSILSIFDRAWVSSSLNAP